MSMKTIDAEDFKNEVAHWTGVVLDWKEADIIFAGARDGGEIIGYFKKLIRKIEKAERDFVKVMEASEEFGNNEG